MNIMFNYIPLFFQFFLQVIFLHWVYFSITLHSVVSWHTAIRWMWNTPHVHLDIHFRLMRCLYATVVATHGRNFCLSLYWTPLIHYPEKSWPRLFIHIFSNSLGSVSYVHFIDIIWCALRCLRNTTDVYLPNIPDHPPETIPVFERQVGEIAESGEISAHRFRSDGLFGCRSARDHQQVPRIKNEEK